MFHDVFVGNTATLEATQSAITKCGHNVVIEARRNDANTQTLAIQFWRCAT
jgi:hypothetical protein